MRPIASQQDTNALTSQSRADFMRVQVKDGSGTYQNLSALRGYNWVRSATCSQTVEDGIGKATVQLGRDAFALSLAPLMQGSILNSGVVPLLELGREIKIEAVTLPHGRTPTGSTTWNIVFHGYIDDVDWGESVAVECRDLVARLQDTSIEVERLYGRWQPSRAIRLGTVVKRSNDPLGTATGAQAWRCTTAGTTSGTEPVWPFAPTTGTTQTDGTVTWTYQAATLRATTTAYGAGAVIFPVAGRPLEYWTTAAGGTTGSGFSALLWPSPAATLGQTVTDGTVVWTYTGGLFGTPVETLIQSILDDNLGAGVVALTTPGGASGWYATEFKQQMETLWSALEALAKPLGWDLRYDFATTDFALQLKPVTRSSPTVAWTVPPSLVLDVKKASRSILGIRNAITVIYGNQEAADTTTGVATRPSITVTDATSIARYGRRWASIAEASTSLINTAALATQFAAAVLSDLKEPTVEMEVELPPFWPATLNDLWKFKADGSHFDSDQSLAVVGYTHSWTKDSCSTTLQVRGLPTSGWTRHHDSIAAPGRAPSNRVLSPSVTAALAAAPTIGGGILTHQMPPTRFLPPGTTTAELHVSTSSGFTPSISTFVANISGSRHEVTGLTMGTTYYARVAYRDSKGNVSGFSPEQSFVPQFVTSAALTPQFRASARMIVASSYSFPGDDTALTFSTTADWDSGGGWPGTGGQTYTVQFDGKYRINASVLLSGAATGDRLQIYVQRITTVPATTNILGNVSNAVTDRAGATVLVAGLDEMMSLKSGDTLKIFTRFAGGAGAKTVQAVDVSTGGRTSGSYWEILPVIA